MTHFIIVIPPWDVLVARFGMVEDADNAIQSEDAKLTYAWSNIEDTTQITANRQLAIHLPDATSNHYYYMNSITAQNASLPSSFVEFCVSYREKPLYGTSKTLGDL